MKIVTNFWIKPIPLRQFDWSAVTNNYEGGDPMGYGATEQEAIADLQEQQDDFTMFCSGWEAAMNMGEGLSNSMVESGESHECAVSIPASGVDTSPATNTPKPLPEQIASEYAEPETTGEAGGRTSVERSGGISLVDEQMIELSKWLSKAMGSGEPWEWVDKAKQLLAIIDPFLRTDKPVSLEVCAQALFNDFADEDFGICKREAKVVLTAAGVPFTDEGGE